MIDLMKPVRKLAGKFLGKGEKVDDRIRSARLAKCYTCPYLADASQKVNRKCKLCKCFVVEKTAFSGEQCAINKW